MLIVINIVAYIALFVIVAQLAWAIIWKAPRSDMVRKYGWWDGTQIEIGWWIKKRAGDLWELFGRDRVSYWLDWLPAWGQRRYYRALNRALRKRGER